MSFVMIPINLAFAQLCDAQGQKRRISVKWNLCGLCAIQNMHVILLVILHGMPPSFAGLDSHMEPQGQKTEHFCKPNID